MAKRKQPVTINDLEFDALISEDRSYEATVPQYAVEDGFCISDAIIHESQKVDMTLYVTETPVTWRSSHGYGENHVIDTIKKLESLYFDAEPVTVYTRDETYTNMAIQTMTVSKSVEIGYAREIQITFVKIRTTTAKTTTIPASYGKSGATGASAGTANAEAGNTNSSNSEDGSKGSSFLANALDKITAWAKN